jgi:hypothetical protein
VRYQLKTPYSDRTTHVLFEPLDCLAQVAALVPKPPSTSRPVRCAAGRCASSPASRIPHRSPPDLRWLAGERDRRARYSCAILPVRHAEAPEPIIAEGRWHGEVIDLPRGAGGFCYDPYFLIPALSRTEAGRGAEEKNTVSHRGKALRRLLAMVRDADRRTT